MARASLTIVSSIGASGPGSPSSHPKAALRLRRRQKGPSPVRETGPSGRDPVADSGRILGDRLVRRQDHRAVVEPPAAEIFSAADLENLCAVTFTATEISPSPSTLTGWFLRTAPLATSWSTSTVPP